MRFAAKQRLKAGKPIIGVHLSIASPTLVELCGYAGFHWLYLDCEHGPMGWEAVENMIRAAEIAGISPFVRLASAAPEEILHALDCGADGVVVPHVETVADAEAAVRAAKFHPIGERSMGGARWSRFNTDGRLAEVVKEANEGTMVVVMVESLKAAQNAAELAAVDGVDMLRIGPNDLSQSMGFAGQPNHAEVEVVMEEVIAATTRVGKVASVGCNDVASAKRWLASGAMCTNILIRDLVVGGGRNFLKGLQLES